MKVEETISRSDAMNDENWFMIEFKNFFVAHFKINLKENAWGDFWVEVMFFVS